jgi:hypothetical protein
MNAANCELAKGLVSSTYIRQVRVASRRGEAVAIAQPRRTVRVGDACARVRLGRSKNCLSAPVRHRQARHPPETPGANPYLMRAELQGSEALARRHNTVRTLLSNRRLPTAGWDDATIEMFVQVRVPSQSGAVLHQMVWMMDASRNGDDRTVR